MDVRVESAEDRGRTGRLAWLALVLLALLPSLGTLSAPWIAEDAAILEKVARSGPWADWVRSQYGVHQPLFWRPLVSSSWALQEASSGIEPTALRLFNLAAHVGVVLLVSALARRLGAGAAGAFLAGAWIALFPEQGGTSTWIAGRTDLLAALFLVASTWVGLGRRAFLAAPLAFLACSAKEFGFLAPLWILVLARARGEGWRAALARAGPAGLAVGLALLWRRAALGSFVGGYPAQLPGLSAGLLGAGEALGAAAWFSLAGFLLLGVAGWVAHAAERRAAVGASLLALSAWAPLYALLADGHLEPQNRRLFYVAECALALGLGLAWSRSVTRARAVCAVLALAVLGGRFALAWNDTHEWARAAWAGEAEVLRARAAVAGATPAEGPVLFPSFPSAYEGAYCLGFGLAARFRAPFPAAPRPVWPWRLIYAADAAREQLALVAPRADGSLWPLDDELRVPELVLRDASGVLVTHARIDEHAILAAEDRSPRFSVAGAPADALLAGVLYSELGYEPVPLGALDANGAGSFTLMQLLASTNGAVAGAQLFTDAADLGATRAYLELRALDASGAVRAASRWVELTWPAELPSYARALNAR